MFNKAVDVGVTAQLLGMLLYHDLFNALSGKDWCLFEYIGVLALVNSFNPEHTVILSQISSTLITIRTEIKVI